MTNLQTMITHNYMLPLRNPQTMSTEEIRFRIGEITDLDLDWISPIHREEYDGLWDEDQRRKG
jgi:hypothetical protein